MGLKFGVVEQLLALTKRTDFAPRTAVTIGRLNVYLRTNEWRALVAIASPDVGARLRVAADSTAFGGYADALLSALWPNVAIDVMDASDYEGANLLHDLNQPLPMALHGAYDLVIEAGTIEHIFNVAEAIRTLLRLVREQGVVVLDTPANNLCGHGFFQVSPELIYRVFCAENGFRLDTCLLEEFRFPSTELSTRKRVVVPRDPSDVRDRVRVMTSGAAELCAVATRLGSQDPFGSGWPMQSDYQTLWAASGDEAQAEKGMARVIWRRLQRLIPEVIRERVRGRREVLEARLSNGRKFDRYPG